MASQARRRSVRQARAGAGLPVAQRVQAAGDREHHRLIATRGSFGWIQKYIFPGGLIPSLQAIHEVTRDSTDLRVERVQAFGADYAETLRRWRETFLEQWPSINSQGFDETFRRMWEFYLAYCEAGFATHYLDVAQIRLARRDSR